MKLIIVLDVNTQTDGGFLMVNAVFWFPVTATPIPRPGATSLYKDATQAELQAIVDGSVVEEPRTFPFPVGTTLTNIAADLVQFYNARKNWRDAQPAKGQHYGKYYNSENQQWA